MESAINTSSTHFDCSPSVKFCSQHWFESAWSLPCAVAVRLLFEQTVKPSLLANRGMRAGWCSSMSARSLKIWRNDWRQCRSTLTFMPVYPVLSLAASAAVEDCSTSRAHLEVYFIITILSVALRARIGMSRRPHGFSCSSEGSQLYGITRNTRYFTPR
jgi:hypothetical protein